MQKMIIDEIKTYKKALLLQGPRGFFFTKFGAYLKRHGLEVYKINFNGGDMFFYPCPNAYSFTKHIDKWANFMQTFITEKKIDCIFLFNDCRSYHQIAIKIAQKIGVPVFVFEEGYIRPNHITFEKHGINGHSRIPCNPQFYLSLPNCEIEKAKPANKRFYKIAINAFIYHFFELLMRWRYPHYRYPKKFSFVKEPLLWIRSGIRKLAYRIKEKNINAMIMGHLKKRYFFAPLQVADDSQIIYHSKYSSINDFIEEVITSFSGFASKDHFLVFKHHPMDRGHKNYDNIIKFYAKKHNISERVIYVHDLHLPSLIRNSLGVVLINSTTGMSSLYHGAPTKVMGNAIYDIEGLTYQGNLDNFWQNPGTIDYQLYKQFRGFVIENTQLNGSFYGLWPFDN